jgi:hypothetical protein
VTELCELLRSKLGAHHPLWASPSEEPEASDEYREDLIVDGDPPGELDIREGREGD